QLARRDNWGQTGCQAGSNGVTGEVERGDTVGTQTVLNRPGTVQEPYIGGQEPRNTRLSPSWKPTDAHRKRAKESGLNVDDEAEKFRLHAEEKGRMAVSWNAAFTRWLINAAKWSPSNKQTSSSWDD